MRKGKQEKSQSPEYIRKKMIQYFIASFKYSQGNLSVQAMFHEWAINQGEITQSDLTEFGKISPKDLLRMVSLPKYHVRIGAGSLMRNILNEATSLKQIETDVTFQTSQKELAILVNLLALDTKYMDDKQRPAAALKPSILLNTVDSIHDPRASYIRKYAFQPKNVHEPVFRRLFKQLHTYCLQAYIEITQSKKYSHPNIALRLSHLKRRWDLHHPQHDFFEPLKKS